MRLIMANHERILEQASELIRRATSDVRQRRNRRRKRRRRAFARFVRTSALLALATVVIIVTMIATRTLLGPLGVEGAIAAPLALIVAWTAIIFGSRAARPTPQTIVKADLAQLPAQTEEWLDRQRWTLPADAQLQLDAIVLRLETLAPQLQRLDAQQPSAIEIRRLLGEELPELVRNYQKVPQALQRQPLYGGPSPDRQLVEGLTTIDEEIGRMHARLAADDLHALATQQRYLETKYKRDGKLE
jgi:hypothetical protein